MKEYTSTLLSGEFMVVVRSAASWADLILGQKMLRETKCFPKEAGSSKKIGVSIQSPPP